MINGIQIAIIVGVSGDNSISPVYPNERVTDNGSNRYTDDGQERIID